MLPKSAPCAMDTFGSIEIEKIDCSTHPNTDGSIGGWSELTRSPSNSDQFCAAFTRCRDMYITQESTQSLRSHYQPVDIIAHVGFMTEEEHNAYNKTSEVSSKNRVISRVVRSIMAASSLYHEKFSPDMLEFMKEKYTVEAPSKIRALMDLLAAPINRSEKSIVFAHYVQTAVQVDALVRKTYPRGVAVFLIVSSMNQKERESILQRCESCRGAAVLVTTKIMSQGRDMSFANHTFMLRVWWNDVDTSQSRARTERPDQTRSVFSTQIIMRDTIEELVWMVARCKERIKNQVMTGEVTSSLLKNITMMSVFSTCVEMENFIRVSHEGGTPEVTEIIKQSCDIYIDVFPYTVSCLPPTKAITPLSSAPHLNSSASSRPKRPREIIRSEYPQPSFPTLSKVNTMIHGHHPKQFRADHRQPLSYQRLIQRTPSSSSAPIRKIVVIKEDGTPTASR